MVENVDYVPNEIEFFNGTKMTTLEFQSNLMAARVRLSRVKSVELEMAG